MTVVLFVKIQTDDSWWKCFEQTLYIHCIATKQHEQTKQKKTDKQTKTKNPIHRRLLSFSCKSRKNTCRSNVKTYDSIDP